MVPDRGGEAQRAGDLVGALLGGSLGRGLGPAQKAARAWYAANGDRERAHTTRVWLRKSGRTGQDPVLVVELDAGWLAGELSTNKELYLSRLAFRGIRVSDICFKVGRRQDVAALRARPTPGEPPSSRDSRKRSDRGSPVPRTTCPMALNRAFLGPCARL